MPNPTRTRSATVTLDDLCDHDQFRRLERVAGKWSLLVAMDSGRLVEVIRDSRAEVIDAALEAMRPERIDDDDCREGCKAG